MTDALEQWVIYRHPSVFSHHPGEYVVRRWIIARGQVRQEHATKSFDSLEAARASIPEGMYWLGRGHHEDPSIIEVWT